MKKNFTNVYKNEIITSLDALSVRMSTARSILNSTNDDELLESCMYELKYLQCRYSYLLRLAREEGCEDMHILRKLKKC